MRIGYIDGAALEAELESLSSHLGGLELDFDRRSFIGQILGCDRVFYYDSLPVKRVEESNEEFESRLAAKQEVFRKLAANSNIHVKNGSARYNRRRGLHQKGVDVLLATDALYDALTGVSKEAVFLLSDLDFYPIFDRLAHSQARTVLIYWKGVTSSDMIEVSDSAREINYWELIEHLGGGQREAVLPYTEGGVVNPLSEAERELAVDGMVDDTPCCFWFDPRTRLYHGWLATQRIRTPYKRICLDFWTRGATHRLNFDESRLP